MRKTTLLICLLTVMTLAQFGLTGSSVDTTHYEQTVEKTEQIKEEMDQLNYQVDQARDFLVVLYGDHGKPDPFEESSSAEENAGTLQGSIDAAEEARAKEHLGNFWDLPDTISDLLERSTELLPTVVEDLESVATDLEENPASATELSAIQDNLNEARDNLQATIDQLPMIQADVETITAILEGLTGE